MNSPGWRTRWCMRSRTMSPMSSGWSSATATIAALADPSSPSDASSRTQAATTCLAKSAASTGGVASTPARTACNRSSASAARRTIAVSRSTPRAAAISATSSYGRMPTNTSKGAMASMSYGLASSSTYTVSPVTARTALARSAVGCTWIEMARPGASTFRRNGSRAPKCSTHLSPSSPTGSAATTAARSGALGRSVTDGPASCTPIHSSDSGSGLGMPRPWRLAMATCEPQESVKTTGCQVIHRASSGRAGPAPMLAPGGLPLLDPTHHGVGRRHRECLHDLGVVLVAEAEVDPFHGGERCPRVGPSSGEVVEGVGDLDDPARQWHHLTQLAHLAVRRGLCLHVVGHGLKPLRMADDAGPFHRDVPLVARCREHCGTAGDRLPQGELAEVVEEGGVLEVAQLAVGEAEQAPDPHAEVRDPLRVRDGGVAAVLRQLGQGGDRLAVGHAVSGIPLDGDVGDGQWEECRGQRGQAEDRGHEGDQWTGGDDGEGERCDLTGLVPQGCRPRGALALGAYRRRQDDLHDEADGRHHHHRRRDEWSRDGRVEGQVPQRPPVTPHVPGQDGRHGDTDEPGRQLVEPRRSAAHPPDHCGDAETGGDDEHDEPARHVEDRLAVDLAEERDGQGRRGGERGRVPPTRHPEPHELADGDGDDEGENRDLVDGDELAELPTTGQDALPEDEDPHREDRPGQWPIRSHGSHRSCRPPPHVLG